MATRFNVIISGLSVSGDLDTRGQPLIIQLGNSDRIGSAKFSLQSKDSSSYQRLTGVSGNATISIDAIPASGITQTVFRGTIEDVVPSIDANTGAQVEVVAYDYGQELLGIVSPDGRPPSLFSGSILSLTSGEQGISAPNGMDLATYVSGVNFGSGATLSRFMAQYFGRSGDLGGSFSGSLFSFKHHISGYTWRTWYYPDASGGVISNDNNANYFIPIDTFKVKREYAWDVLRRITRQGIVVDSAKNRVAFEAYIGVSGDIHIFTSGSYEFLLSGIMGQLVLQYYAAGTSGATLNNIIRAKLPNDTTNVKNEVVAWFPAWTTYPLDLDTFTDLIAYSGAFWSGAVQAGGSSLTLSGGPPASTTGMISIQVLMSGVGSSTAVLNYRHFSGVSININRLNVINPNGFGAGVVLNWSWYSNVPQIVETPIQIVTVLDSGLTNSIQTTATITPLISGWINFSLPIFGSGGAFNSGAWSASATFPNLSQVKEIRFRTTYSLPAGPGGYAIMAVDNIYFSFNYPFSPVVAFNSGSQGMYGRRYAVTEFPFQVTLEQASGLATNELLSRMGSKQVADITIKDNPLQRQPIQLTMKPGQVVVIDAPALNTGSGQTFYYWKAIDVEHHWSTTDGFITHLRLVPWFSGTLVDPNSNLVDYQLPLQYVQPQPPPDRNLFMPGYPYTTLV